MSRTPSLLDPSSSWSSTYLPTGAYALSFPPSTMDPSAMDGASVFGPSVPPLTISTDASTSTIAARSKEQEAIFEQVQAFVTPLTIPVTILCKDSNEQVSMLRGALTSFRDGNGIFSNLESVLTAFIGPSESLQVIPPSKVCGVIFHDQSTFDLYRHDLPLGVGGTFLQRTSTANGMESLSYRTPLECSPLWVRMLQGLLDEIPQSAGEWGMYFLEQVAREILALATELGWRLVLHKMRILLVTRAPAQRPGNLNGM